jgi:hypothetical protein
MHSHMCSLLEDGAQEVQLGVGRSTPARKRKLQQKCTGITTTATASSLPLLCGIGFAVPDWVTWQLRLSGVRDPLESSTRARRLRAKAPTMHGPNELPQDPSPPGFAGGALVPQILLDGSNGSQGLGMEVGYNSSANVVLALERR